MKVALVQAPVWWTIDPPLGLAQMAGCAMQYGHDVSVFDLNILLWKDRLPKYQNMWLWEQFHFWNNPQVVADFFNDNRRAIEGHVQSILRTDAKAVCFSVALGNQLASSMIARMVKKEAPKKWVVFGGQYFFRDNQKAKEVILLDKNVDIVVRGASDHLFPKLLSVLETRGEPRPIRGLLYKQGRVVTDTGFIEPLRQLDSVPFADFTKFPMEVYEDQNRIPIAASRGCVWACRFCSSCNFWPGYSYMSGERIYAEILFHRRLFPQRFHVEFYDITANGRPESLSKLCDLIIEHESRTGWKHFKWKINAIIRPEMTPELLMKMALANCQDIIYGIESGSPRVLKLMNKHYNVDVAERVLHDTHAAGIKAVGNFMFGFPGETEQDFQMTLDFLRKNQKSFDRVYASATFTSLEEHSYLTEHQESFGVVKSEDKHNSLYWQNKDGSNNYLVRLDRYKRFRDLAIELGIDAYKGLAGSVELDHVLNRANYYEYMDHRYQAVSAYSDYLAMDPMNEPIRHRLREFQKELAGLARGFELLRRWEREQGVSNPLGREAWRALSPHLLKERPIRAFVLGRKAGAAVRSSRGRKYLKALLALHNALQKLKCRATLRRSGSRVRLFYGTDLLENEEQVAGLTKRVDRIVVAAPGVSGKGGVPG
ncbi:MAG TPA: radical SAM protein [Elusimicrobiota bacterium]|nr:radical SAM protein [Elusimicrobiota bacterium]